jgi:hypothetical protein
MEFAPYQDARCASVARAALTTDIIVFGNHKISK